MSSSGASSNHLTLLTEMLRVNQIVDYGTIIAITIVFYDYFHTLPREIRLMWPSKLSLPKVLYFCLRYLLLAHSILWATSHAKNVMYGNSCISVFSRNAITCDILLILCEGIGYVRVYAFSGGNKYLLAFLVLHYLGVNIVTTIYIKKVIGSISFLNFSAEAHLRCLPIKVDEKAMTATVATLITSATTVATLMIIIAIRRQENLWRSKGLFKTFYQDGIYYFVSIAVIATTNIIVFLLAPENGMKLLFVQPLVHFSAVLSTRMLLHLREWSEKEEVFIVGSEVILDRLARDTTNLSTLRCQEGPGQRGTTMSTRTTR
ncbi:hypothetical protein DFP72DRAFT_932447 [Ephemerocybe angulata]|uniref:DUF6533 domain-containing protein n=1 Tax=Ephemerocybe angulata TaxID=980116 RepID=A0A8H6HCB7_9AGAR|nr:hypothetical protein DFP72DRAFT_932447 [Tulosesus angulatus]